MAKWALLFGAILFGLGMFGYFGDDGSASAADATEQVGSTSQDTAASEEAASASSASKKTALIPAVVGMALLICGTLGLDERMRKHAMHVAAGIALLGALAALSRVGMKMGAIMEGDISRAMVYVLIMAVVCTLYVVLSIRSFRNAPRQRQEAKS